MKKFVLKDFVKVFTPVLMGVIFFMGFAIISIVILLLIAYKSIWFLGLLTLWASFIIAIAMYCDDIM